MGVSKNSGTPKWMVVMENPIKMDDLGYHYFWKHPCIDFYRYTVPETNPASLPLKIDQAFVPKGDETNLSTSFAIHFSGGVSC